MKKFLLSAFTLALFTTAVAAPRKFKLLKSTAKWDNASNWSPVGVPSDGDTIVIAENIQLTLSDDLELQSVYLDLYGSLILSGQNMKLVLKNLSTINVHSSGWIDGSKASQQIVLGSIIFKGSDPLLTGPKIATNASQAFVPYAEPTVLPVKFISFRVSRISAGNQIQWTTVDEKNASYYEVQHSSDGNSWKTIATVFATGNTENNYSISDKASYATTGYYRIKQVDTDGTCAYTSMRIVKAESTTAPAIKAVQNSVTVLFPQTIKGSVVIEIIGINGLTASKQTITNASGSIQISTSLRGMYIVHVSNGREVNVAKQVVF